MKETLDICKKNNLSKRQLHELIKQKSYNRLSNDAKNKLIKSKELKIEDLIPNPIIIKSNLFKERTYWTSTNIYELHR